MSVKSLSNCEEFAKDLRVEECSLSEMEESDSEGEDPLLLVPLEQPTQAIRKSRHNKIGRKPRLKCCFNLSNSFQHNDRGLTASFSPGVPMGPIFFMTTHSTFVGN